MYRRASLALVLFALSTAACVPSQYTGGQIQGDRWRTIKVTNQYSTSVVLYPSLSGTTLWARLDRVPAHTTRLVRVPASYLRRDFQILVCSSSGSLGQASCVRTNRYSSHESMPNLVIFPTPDLHAELFG